MKKKISGKTTAPLRQPEENIWLKVSGLSSQVLLRLYWRHVLRSGPAVLVLWRLLKGQMERQSRKMVPLVKMKKKLHVAESFATRQDTSYYTISDEYHELRLGLDYWLESVYFTAREREDACHWRLKPTSNSEKRQDNHQKLYSIFQLTHWKINSIINTSWTTHSN